MKVTVSQIDATNIDADWAALTAYTQAEGSDFVLLPEMPFAPWFFTTKNVDRGVWNESVQEHEAWLVRLPELGAPIVAGSVPVNQDGKHLNIGFVWTADAGMQLVHAKTFLPDEDGFWEATWYDRGPVDFQTAEAGDAQVGFMICTEMWFTEHARDYAKAGAHLLLAPRCTGLSTVDKWIAGGRAAAVMSGGYCLSSNHSEDADGTALGGAGWIIDPDGDVLGVTSFDSPFCSVDVDLSVAEAAKSSYPRYVIE